MIKLTVSNRSLAVGNQNVRFYIEAGWFNGEDFSLLKIDMFHKMIDWNLLTILELRVAKFIIGIGIDWE